MNIPTRQVVALSKGSLLFHDICECTWLKNQKPSVESQTTSTMRLRGIPWSSQWLALDNTDAEATAQQGPKGFVEFDVTNAVKDWSSGVPNNGLVIRATNELDAGRDTRFASNANSDTSKHAFVLVHCSDEVGTYTPSQQPYTTPFNLSNTPSEDTTMSNPTSRGTDGNGSSTSIPTFGRTTAAPPVHDVQTYDTGAGKVYKLSVTQDVTLERGNINWNSLEYLIVSKHPGFPNKRSLIQFQNLPITCPSKNVFSAKMYLYYEYSHKASFSSIKSVPFIPRYLQVYLVKKPWVESQTTSNVRLRGILWSSPWLALNGTDAEANPQQGTVTTFPYRPKGFVEFDVTNAVKDWRSGVPNNGLVIRATNELDAGRDTRFSSNPNSDTSKHAFVIVHCKDEGGRYNPSQQPYTTPSHTSSTTFEQKNPNPSLALPTHDVKMPDTNRLSVTQNFTLERGSDGTNKQLQKQGGGWSVHKSSLMAFIPAFFVSTASALM